MDEIIVEPIIEPTIVPTIVPTLPTNRVKEDYNPENVFTMVQRDQTYTDLETFCVDLRAITRTLIADYALNNNISPNQCIKVSISVIDS